VYKRQVLINIITNAVKFTEKGSINITIERERGSNKLRFIITDTGVGIPKNRLSSIFQPFTQADNSITRQYGGTGLGLSISKKLVEFMEGDIYLESEVGKGTTFIISIPFTLPYEKYELDQPQSIAYENRKEDQNSEWKILIVDDNDINLMVAHRLFKKLGFDVDQANSGLEALRMCGTKPYQLIFMDISMPVMDGIVTARKIRENNEFETEPVIVAMTAHAMSGDRESFLNRGMDDYISKPIRSEKLNEIIMKYSHGNKINSNNLPTGNKDDFIDMNELREKFHNDTEFIKELLTMFIAESPEKMDEIIISYEKNDLNALKETAHYLKGVSANLCMVRTADMFERLQHFNSQYDISIIFKTKECLEETIDQIRSFLKEEVV
jgi:CheY-like chemotaxis protein/HPt (histidine-containing phosphotransfer) domain-containing protein